jgi:hypothetical protein
MSLPSGLREDKLATMGTDRPRKAARHLRIRVSDMASGVIKVDLRLPLGSYTPGGGSQLTWTAMTRRPCRN